MKFIAPTIFLIFLSHFSQAQPIKECPQSVGNRPVLLDETFPVHSFVIGDSSSGSYLINTVLKIIQAHDEDYNDLPILLIKANSLNWSVLTKKINELKFKSPDSKQKLLSKLKWLNNNIPEAGAWNQDYFQAFADVKTGQPLLRALGGYLDGGWMSGSFMKNMVHEINNELKEGFVISGSPIENLGWASSYHMGGNIEAAPGNICLVGDHPYVSDRDQKAFTDQICQRKEDLIEPPVSFLEVGHTDEIFKTIPSKTSCGVSFLISSPKKALELLEQNPDEKALQVTQQSAHQTIKSTADFVKYSLPLDYICKSYLIKKGHYVPTLSTYKVVPAYGFQESNNAIGFRGSIDVAPPVESSMSFDGIDKDIKQKITSLANAAGGIKNLPFILRYYMNNSSDLEIRAKVLKILDTGRFSLEHRNFQNWYTSNSYKCGEMKNKDLKEILLSYKPNSKSLADSYTKIQSSLDQFKNEFEQKFLARNKTCKSVDWIEVPNLYFRYLQGDDTPESLVGDHEFSDIFPSPTNSVSLNKLLLVSDPINSSFRRYLSDVLNRKIDGKVLFVDSLDHHPAQGNLHCVTQALRTCAPRN